MPKKPAAFGPILKISDFVGSTFSFPAFGFEFKSVSTTSGGTTTKTECFCGCAIMPYLRDPPALLSLLGVGLSGLTTSDDTRQLALFDDGSAGESDRDRDVSRAVDTIADRFGHGTVVPGRIVGPSPGRRPSPPSDSGSK